MIKCNVLIIGGGASGLICASMCKSADVYILEKEDKVGKKILATGNGRCNLTNMDNFESAYNTDISKYLHKFNNINTIEYFNDLGALTYSDQQNRVYPLSNLASSVLDVLRFEVEQNGVKINTNQTVVDVAIKQNLFYVTTNSEVYVANKVVIATGGNGFLPILEKLKISYAPLVPSLTALKTESLKELSGIRLNNVNVKHSLVPDFSENGEIIFKDNGISGIVILNLSAYLARVNNFQGNLIINILPTLSYNDLQSYIDNKISKNVSVERLLNGLMHKQLAKVILNRCNIYNLLLPAYSLSAQDVKNIIETIRQFKINVVGALNNNQVCCGGVLLAGLSDNLECLHIPNLYFAGEIVNVDGLCGGYNLQWAWTSGAIVGKNI